MEKRSIKHRIFLALTLLGTMGLASVAASSPPDSSEWRTYGGNSAGDRYSGLSRIKPSNVHRLKQVWRFDTGPGGLQTTPLMIGDTLYAVTPKQEVVALDAATGTLRWTYSPTDANQQPVRGLTWWEAGKDRILFTSHGTFLAALDPATGWLIKQFGTSGLVDLREGLGRDPAKLAVFMTSPGVIYRDLIITGFRTGESKPAAPGAIRAYDVRTGALRWTFRTVPLADDPAAAGWRDGDLAIAGGANAWAGMVVDDKRGIVFAPTGSAVDDFYGGDRKGDNLYANSLIAMDATTGIRLWHFQAVHHDVLDRDFPTPPVLLTVRHQDRKVDAVAQGSKQGLIFLLDRATGKPLFPIEERPVPQSDVPGEATSPTQPFPVMPLPVAQQKLTADMLTNRTPAANTAAREQFARMKSDGPFAPLSTDRQTIVYPGFDGGMEWGGPAVDRKRGILFVNVNEMAWTGGLKDTGALGAQGYGAQIYQQNCAACHGLDGAGSPPDFPAVKGILTRMSPMEVFGIISQGKGRMPGFPQLEQADIIALFSHLEASDIGGETREVAAPADANTPLSRFLFTGYRKFLDADGYPAISPPWGTLNAIDMNSGDRLWSVPLGFYPELAVAGKADTGTENYGGPMVTSTGLLFIGATLYDRMFRAFDTKTGKRLWQAELPFAGTATPVTYMLGGKQFVVIATSGARNPKGPQGSAYIAFALENAD